MNTQDKPNQLINEISPYLLQHAYNPVDWYPWCDKAFEKAAKEEKPIFLSIGYSTCHWCHVMAHESFEDQEVADKLNKDFICIKVDREERPDIDAVYMSVCQGLTGSGGWPLTIVMTSDQKPFFAGTYFPKNSQYQSLGLLELLSVIAREWKEDRSRLLEAGNQISDQVRQNEEQFSPPIEPTKELIRRGATDYSQRFDAKNGGFSSAPKFPAPHNLLFLLNYAYLEKDEVILKMVEKTLQFMYLGGIYDHIGGGFSRYSTDSKWLIPHFEKMLYDNALLAYTYLEAFHITKNPLYEYVAKRTLDYVLNELTDSKGGFYCGQDADSDGVEGKYYVFYPEEILQVLGDEDGLYFCSQLDITPEGNFEKESVPNYLMNPKTTVPEERLSKLYQRLYDYRKQRTTLHTDDKILTSWNGLMIAAFAKAYKLTGEKKYWDVAHKSQQFIASHLMDEKGYLKLRFGKGEAAIPGQLNDYACYIFALLELYRGSFAPQYLNQAIDLAEKMIHLFYDEENSGFFLYSKEGEMLISRPKEIYDAALPSGNSMAANVLDQLFRFTAEPKWKEYGYKQFCFQAANMQNHPSGFGFTLFAMTKLFYPNGELVCCSNQSQAPEELLSFFNKHFMPNLTILLKTPENEEELSKCCSFTKTYPISKDGMAQYYFCQNGTCSSSDFSLQEILSYF